MNAPWRFELLQTDDDLSVGIPTVGDPKSLIPIGPHRWTLKIYHDGVEVFVMNTHPNNSGFIYFVTPVNGQFPLYALMEAANG